MSFLLSPVLDVGIRLTLSAAGYIIYYTGSGIWWLGKRAIYGHKATPEKEAAQIRLIQQNENLVELLHELIEKKSCRAAKEESDEKMSPPLDQLK